MLLQNTSKLKSGNTCGHWFNSGEVAEPFNYSRAAAAAYAKGQLSEDMKHEQEKVTKADLIIFQVKIILLISMFW